MNGRGDCPLGRLRFIEKIYRGEKVKVFLKPEKCQLTRFLNKDTMIKVGKNVGFLPFGMFCRNKGERGDYK